MDASVLRILDTNFNRAREALRVLEEHARLVLEDAALCGRIKEARHALAGVGDVFARGGMLAHRDIEGDVGATVSTPDESARVDAAAVALAAAKRATEALRCIEEYGKTIDPEAASGAERLRYRVYALEQEVVVSGPRRARLRKARLHVLLSESLCRGPWLDVARQALEGGADVLQLREKSLPDRALLDRAGQLREITAAAGALLVINDRPDIARLVGADGVHVGQDDLSIGQARTIGGPTILVGQSTHSIEQARAALAKGPDYLGLGPMFASETKPNATARGPALLGEVLEFADCPVVAIGGIDPSNVGELRACGDAQWAVCQAVIGAPDAAEACRALLS